MKPLSVLLALAAATWILDRPAVAEPAPWFEDSFDAGLAEGWTWLRADPADWCIRQGGLEIRNRPGNAQSVRNALLRPAPDRSSGRVAIEVTVHHHAPLTEQFEQAGITWYIDGQPAFKFVKELIDGELFVFPGKRPMTAQKVRLRVIVSRDRWEAQYQPHATGEFLTAATGELPSPGREQVSLQAYHGPAQGEHWVRFDDFRIVRLPD